MAGGGSSRKANAGPGLGMKRKDVVAVAAGGRAVIVWQAMQKEGGGWREAARL